MTDWRLKDSVDAILLRCIEGLRAVTFQNYTEVNIKTGAQRVASAILTVNAGAQNYIGFRTGALPVVIKPTMCSRLPIPAQGTLLYTGG